MFEFLKIIHLLALAVAMGMTTANLIAMRYVSTLDAGDRAAFGPLQRLFGAFGFMAVAFLWVTGIALLLLRYDLTALGGWVHAKLLAVVVLTALVITLRKTAMSAARDGGAPPMARMR